VEIPCSEKSAKSETSNFGLRFYVFLNAASKKRKNYIDVGNAVHISCISATQLVLLQHLISKTGDKKFPVYINMQSRPL